MKVSNKIYSAEVLTSMLSLCSARNNAIQHSENMNIVNDFIREWVICTDAKSVLHLNASTYNLFSNLNIMKSIEVYSAQDIPQNTLYDLILGDIPLDVKPVIEWNDGVKAIKTQKNWLEMLKSLCYLKENGTALFILQPWGFIKDKGVAFEKELNEQGYFTNAFINCPIRIHYPIGVITPVLVVLSKMKTDQLFVAELLDNTQAREVARAYSSKVNLGDLIRGTYIDTSDYFGFDSIKIKQQIERLETQYKSYEKYSLGELTIEINYAKRTGKHHDRDNAIYMLNFNN